MDTMTLCLIAPEFFPVWGGTGTYIVELIKHLPRNVNVHVVTLKRNIPGMSNDRLVSNSITSEIGRPMEIHYISNAEETFFYNVVFQIACLRKIPALQRKYRFDIIHSHSHMPDVFLQLFNKIRVPTVLTVHSTIQTQKIVTLMACSRFSDLERSEKYTLLFYPIIKLLQQNYVKHISRFIAVSNVTRELVMKHYNVDPERISVVHNGVDTELFHPPTKNEVEKKFSRPTVVYIGRMMAKKGVHILIKAMSDVIRRVPKTRFLFVGGGNLSLYKKMIEQRAIPEKNFSFIGHVDRFECPRILGEATVFVNPSFFENCSLSILEAMSCGTAVVASDVGGNPEIIESGKNGKLVPPFDDKMLARSIISLLENENLNKEIGKEARRTVETGFSSKKCAEETYNVYRHILNGAY